MPPPAAYLLHGPLAALVRAYGAPASVATQNDGQYIVFADAGASVTAIVDDDATIHAVDLMFPPGTIYALDVDGTTHRFTFGTTTSIAARDELATSAETEGANFRVFRCSEGEVLVLRFDPATAKLAHIVVGDRATLLRLGYVRDPVPDQPKFPFVAPVLRHSAIADGTGTKATVLRLDLDRAGIVRNVAVVVASDDPAVDQQLTAQVGHDIYAPAKLGGRVIGASVFREIRH
jgi:hypothetical protein